jgi:hypothetical protein
MTLDLLVLERTTAANSASFCMFFEMKDKIQTPA